MTDVVTTADFEADCLGRFVYPHTEQRLPVGWENTFKNN